MTASTALQPADIAALLRSDPILGHLPGLRLAGLLAHVEPVHLSKGDRVATSNAKEKNLIRILRGRVAIEDGPRRCTKSDGYLGEEALFGGSAEGVHAVACEDVTVLVVPLAPLRALVEADADLRARFFASYAHRFAPSVPPAPAAPSRAQDAPGRVSDVLGWLAAIAAPMAIYALGPTLNLSPAAIDFLAIIAATVAMWLFALVPEYVPPLFASLAVILLDVARPEQTLSGFGSESFFMCLSVFGLGALLISSGLTYRFALWVLARVPPNQAGYNASLFGLGAILLPIIPSVVGRVTIVSPFLIELIQISDAGAKDLYANRLIYSLLGGAALLVPMVLTASVPNLVVYGLLDPQSQFAFDWIAWLWAASAYGLTMVLAFILVSAVFFRGARSFSLPRAIIHEQSRLLGPISVHEWLAAISIGAMTIGILTEALHRVDFPWVALAIFVTLMLFGSLKRDALRAQIDWPVLVYIGAIIGWVPIAKSTGLDDFVVFHLSGLGAFMQTQLPLFVLMVSLAILLVRLALPTGVTVVLFVTALFPVALSQGVSLWVIGFIILAIADTFIFPYQSSYFLKLRNDLEAQGLAQVCDTKRLILANITLIAARVGALYVCLLFWTGLDLI